MKNDFLPFCIDFAKKFKDLKPGTYKSDDKIYTIVKIESDVESDKFNTFARVNNISGIVEIESRLERYSFSAILFLLTWCFLRKIHLKEDNILISNLEIDRITVDLLADCPEFSPKEGMFDLFTILKTTDDNLKRMEQLVTNKKLLKKAFQNKKS